MKDQLRRTPPALRAAGGLLAVALIVSAASGCDSFLDTEPQGQLTSENYFETSEHAVQATNAVYAMLRDWEVHVFGWIGMTDIVSDDAYKGELPGAGFQAELDNLNFDPGNNAFSLTWSGYYKGVYRANVALANIPPIEMDEALKTRLLAENKFLRAYYYFFLVRAFGGVPLLTEPLETENFEQPRASAEEVYALIEQDLQDAIADLPLRSNYDPSNRGRASKGAARALLAKVHLFQDEYQDALQYAEAVINSGEYSLYPDYSYIFTQEGEHSSGSVFEVGQIALEEGGGAGQYSQVQGVRGTPNLGWGFNQPTDDLEAAYEPGDLRQQATVLYPWELLPDASDQVVYINPNMLSQQYSEKAQAPFNTPGGSQNSPVNIRRLRYADVLLMAAEAAYQTGNATAAQNYVNQVRERAREGREATLGIIPDRLAEYIATENLGLSSGSSRVFIRYINGGGPAAGTDLQALESARFDSIQTASTPVVLQHIDLIQSVAGEAVTTPDEYLNVVGEMTPGETVTLEVMRVTQQTQGNSVTTETETVEVDVQAVELLPPVTSTGDELLRSIWHERRVELAMEQHRWFDIIRQGRAEDVMEDVGLNFEPYMTRYPIPQGEIDLSGGTIQQNEGYAGMGSN